MGVPDAWRLHSLRGEGPGLTVHPGEYVVKRFSDPETAKRFEIRSRKLPCAPVFDLATATVMIRWVDGAVLADGMKPSRLVDFLGWCNRRLEWSRARGPIGFEWEAIKEHYRDKTRERYPGANGYVNGNWTVFETKARMVERWHGDLSFENVIMRPDDYVLLDHRPSFGKRYVLAGDVYYDLAKLLKSCWFSHAAANEGAPRPSHPDAGELEARMRAWCELHGWDWKHVQRCAGCVCLSMVPLHPRWSGYLEGLGKRFLYDACQPHG